MKKRFLLFRKMSYYTIYIALVMTIVISGYKVESHKVYNSSGSKFLNSYLLTATKVSEEPKAVTTISTKLKAFGDVLKKAPAESVSFVGTMTAYGPDCVGCSGIVGCSPRRDVRAGNIYYDHEEYGKMRIVASDKRIPCGTIVEVSGVKNSDNFYAIVLDRGGVIKETLFDLLFASEAEAKFFGRQTVNYKTIRWGW